MKSSVVVIGATGGVGSGIIPPLLAAGHPVIAVSRNRENLLRLAERLGHPTSLTVLPASVESDEAGRDLSRQLREMRRRLAGIVVSISPPRTSGRLLDRDEVFLDDKLHANVVGHFIAARHLIPLLAEYSPGALYLSIGSGAAEFPWAGYGHFSIANAALRMLARVVNEESRGLPLRVQQLSLRGVVRTHLNDHCACTEWLDAEEVGRHIVDLLASSDGASAVLGLRAGGVPEPVGAA
ncbi:SDR family NAD(P)-dependent oxidoreductase [Tahibacter amnicola]|uniref:SDR family NAD(P)-dependent oxidoreductase n=1 Tax=Tahibacter amnicola TaxID=2976241 RepID=A0ABY6BG36_9GAMM|nr:SDR family NAD(P)-dependent oxidoreductase [Tahibacter amnicola]UXI68566.1 SDR family NAD(P)-dependent oxidoreductase [Tahibacter amnicola]